MVKKSSTKAASDALRTGKPIKTASIKAKPPAGLKGDENLNDVVDDFKATDNAKTVRADETPEAQPTKAAKTKAAEEQFAKADAAGAPKRDKDEVEAEEIRTGLAARGY